MRLASIGKSNLRHQSITVREMSLNVRELSPELAAKAVKELNEVPSRLPEDVKTLRDWVAKQPHLRARTDDQFLVSFLRGSKHSLERAKEKLDLFFSIRTSLAEVFTDNDPASPRNLELIRMGCMLPLPNTATPDGPRIVLMRYDNDPSKYTMLEMIRVQFFIMNLMLKEDDNLIVGGEIGIIDFKGATLSHFTQFTPSLMKKFALMTQEASPMRMKSFNYMNVPGFFESIFNFFKTFLNDKMKKRLHVHPDNASLYKEIPQKLLPVEYGGENGTIADLVKYWEDKIIANRDYLIQEATFGSDENKRPVPSKHQDALFGAEGSFRKLDVD